MANPRASSPSAGGFCGTRRSQNSLGLKPRWHGFRVPSSTDRGGQCCQATSTPAWPRINAASFSALPSTQSATFALFSTRIVIVAAFAAAKPPSTSPRSKFSFISLSTATGAVRAILAVAAQYFDAAEAICG